MFFEKTIDRNRVIDIAARECMSVVAFRLQMIEHVIAIVMNATHAPDTQQAELSRLESLRAALRSEA